MLDLILSIFIDAEKINAWFRLSVNVTMIIIKVILNTRNFFFKRNQ